MKRVLSLVEKYDRLIFFTTYVFLGFLFFTNSINVGWDPSEYLAMGKVLFGGAGYAAWYRPLVWPIVLGAFWKMGFAMPSTMQILSFLFYFAIPLITYFSFKDGRKWIGLLIVTQPLFFKYSHLPLSHIIATFFLILSYSTKGMKSGIFAVLSGMSRFTFLLYLPFCLWYGWLKGDWKKRAIGILSILIPYFIFTTLFFQNPIIQFSEASNIINYSDFLWVWRGSFAFYFWKFLTLSPLLLFGLFSKKPSRVAFILSFLYFTFLPHKEERFLIDICVYASIALAERFQNLPLLQIIVYVLYLPFIMVPLYYPSPEIFQNIELGATVIGMDPSVNSYVDVEFKHWFDYSSEPNMDADYCVFSKFAVPCPEGHELCESRVNYFKETCESWDIVGRDDVLIIAKHPSTSTS